MRLRMKSLNVFGVHWKTQLLVGVGGGFTKNQCRGGDCLKRGLWTVCKFKGGGTWQEREEGCFWGTVDTPMHNMSQLKLHLFPARISAEAISMTHSEMYGLDNSNFNEPLLFQIFVPWKFITILTFPCLLSLLQSTYSTEKTIEKNSFYCGILWKNYWIFYFTHLTSLADWVDEIVDVVIFIKQINKFFKINFT